MKTTLLLIMKIPSLSSFTRKIEKGLNPDVEITKILSDKLQFEYVPAYLGQINWNKNKELYVLAIRLSHLLKISLVTVRCSWKKGSIITWNGSWPVIGLSLIPQNVLAN